MVDLKIKKIAIAFFLVAIILAPAIGFAQDESKPVIEDSGWGTGWICKTSDTIYDCVPRLYNFALGIAGIIAVGVLVAAGYLRMTSGGDGQQLTLAKEMGAAVAAGLLLLLTAYVLLRFLNPNLIIINRDPGKLTDGMTNTEGWEPAGGASTTQADVGQNFILVSPNAHNITVPRGESVVFEVRAQTFSSRINRVVFTTQPGGRQVNVASPPYRTTISTDSGSDTIITSAQAIDDNGNSVANTQILIKVASAGAEAPMPVQITFPANEASVKNNIEIRTNIPDNATGIRSVRFEIYETEGIDSLIQSETSTGPSYKYVWNLASVPNGRYRVKATAFYSSNISRESEIVLRVEN